MGKIHADILGVAWPMEPPFDPYHRWLGIPAEQQPADHYRLLGLARFEDDHEVIRDGAERQIAHVRRYALGKRAEMSQRILNELAAAKACLLDPLKRAAYDASLREQPGRWAGGSAADCSESSADMAVHPVAASPPPLPIMATVAADQLHLPPPLDLERAAGRALSDSPESSNAKPALPPVLAVGPSSDVASETARGSPPWWANLTAWKRSLIVGAASAGLVLIFACGLAVRNWFRQTSLDVNPVVVRDSQPGVSGPDKATVLPHPPNQDGGGPPGAKRPGLVQPQQPPGGGPAVGSSEPPRPLRLRSIAEQNAREGQTLRVQANVEDPGVPARGVTYRLAPGAPRGMFIDPISGMLAWTPQRDQSQGFFAITVQALNQATGNLEDQKTFAVAVTPRIRPPIIMPIRQQAAQVGKTLDVHLTVRSTDSSPRPLTFSIESGPPGAEIDAQTGEFRWEPKPEHTGGHHFVTIRVTAGEAPEQAEARVRFSIRVAPAEGVADLGALSDANPTPTLPPVVTISLPSGRTVKFDDSELKRQVTAETVEMIQRLGMNKGKKMVVAVPSSSNSDALDSLVSCVVTGAKLEGPAVAFHPGKDPATWMSHHGLRTGVSMSGPSTSSRRVRTPRGLAAKAEIIPRLYCGYRAGTRSGELATWDADGRVQYHGEYISGKRDGICCLYVANELKLIAECSTGDVSTVHLIDGGKLTRSISGEDAALQDSDAAPMINRLNRIESDIKDCEREFRDAARKAVNTKVGTANAQKLSDFVNRVGARDAAANAAFWSSFSRACGAR